MKLTLVFAAALLLGGCNQVHEAQIQARQKVTACQEEDGSGPSQTYPCRWDAQHSGNHQGYSFTVTKQNDQLCYTYDSAAAQRKWGGCDQ